MRVAPDVGIVRDALPVMVGAAKTVPKGKALTIPTGIGAGAVPGEIGENAERSALAEEGDRLAHVSAMSFGNQPQRRLVFVNVLQVMPENYLTEFAQLLAHGQQRVIAVVDVQV